MAIVIDPDIIANWADLLTHNKIDDKKDAERFLRLFLIELGVITRKEEKKMRPYVAIKIKR